MSRPPSDPTPPVPPPVAGPDLAPVRAFRLGLTASELQAAVPWAYLWADADEPPPPLLANVTGELVRHLDRLEELAPESAGAVGALRRAIDALVSAVCSRGSVHRCTWVECRERLTADGVHEQSGARVAAAVCSGWWSVHRTTWVECRERLTADGVHEQSGARVAAFADAPMRPPWDALRDATDAFSAALPHGLRVLFDLGRVVGEAGDASERYRQPGFDPSRWLYVTLAPRVEQLLADARRLHPCLAALPELPCGNAAGGEPPFDGMTNAIRALADRVPALLAVAATQTQSLPAATPIPPAVALSPVAEPAAVETVPAEAVEPPADAAPVLPPFAIPRPPVSVLPSERRNELCAYLRSLDPEGALAGESDAWLLAVDQLRRFARGSGSSILLLGETGAGKTVLGELIHNAVREARAEGESPRARSATAAASRSTKKPSVPSKAVEGKGPLKSSSCVRWQASCSATADQAIPRGELLGYTPNSGLPVEKGGRAGKIEEAAGGTLFVDEFGDLSREVQSLFLDVLEGKPCSRVGGGEPFQPDVIVVFATNKNVRGETTVRQDLLHRISAQVTIPSLRARPDDLFPIVASVLRGRFRLDFRTWELLLRYDWPGNVRELILLLRKVVDDQDHCDGQVSPTQPNARQGRPVLCYETFAGDGRFASVLPHIADEPVAKENVVKWVREVLSARGYKPRSKTASLGPKVSEWLGVSESSVSRWLNPQETTSETEESNPG